PSQSFGLLLEAACFKIELNRRMPNGMYGAVRGRIISALLDLYRFYTYAQRQTKTCGCRI
ncbi:hypothetical protein, partial [Ruminococcus sp.]|uniref:hypothetical protein n=1 Tax=Ruminococcus sp. TaxID=41978 RepID=UPI003866DD00